MDRREFLKKTAMYGAALAFGGKVFADDDAAVSAAADVLAAVQIIDAHAHPDMDYTGIHWTDTSASYRYMKPFSMTSFFSAVGDNPFHRASRGPTLFKFAKRQLDWWLNGIVKDKKVKLVLKISDIPTTSGDDGVPGAILAIEGGDAFEGSLDKIDEFYKMGVRMTTLVHYQNNEIGDIMAVYPGSDPGLFRGGLSDFGYKVIGRMEEIGMVVDVAHAGPATFKDMLSVVTKPVIDSHTNPSSGTRESWRMRPWKEMEMVARTGGVTCTWPIAYRTLPRKTLNDWAKEILVMKQHLGIEHVGLGSDGGGYLVNLVEGYRDSRDLGKLAEAMLEVGLSKEDVAAYMGGNVLRVLQTCIG